MEITPQIDKLLRSSNIDDQRIGLEILKGGGFNDMDYLRYNYRYDLNDILSEYIVYDIAKGGLPALYLGREEGTAVNFIKWK